jgi:hypothetical protein
MKVFLVLLGVIAAAATAFAFGHADVRASVSAVASHMSTEPTVLLLSGSALLGLAGAVRRLPSSRRE